VSGVPQVEIEDARQLAGSSQRHQLAATLESAALNEPVQHFRLQSRDHLRQLWHVEDAVEQRTRVSSWLLRRTVASPDTGFLFRHLQQTVSEGADSR
jgi:hypothetical protein